MVEPCTDRKRIGEPTAHPNNQGDLFQKQTDLWKSPDHTEIEEAGVSGISEPGGGYHEKRGSQERYQKEVCGYNTCSFLSMESFLLLFKR